MEPLLAQLEPRQVRQLARRLATGLRRRQSERIAAQRKPDGSAYKPRAPQRVRHAAATPGHHRRERKRVQSMFAKLRTTKHLKARASGDAATIEIAGRSARIASVHQYGLLDQPQPGGPEIRYPTRQLLGLSAGDLEWLQDQVLQSLRTVQ
ncbi:phage virion morphogenesis protein [Ideonella sp. YS5]|uniref:phage virion morphogenesis protein n=1 Tax=Ideonella sp. YS5 TaxID=3453714 RepID=UPI003EE8E206